MNILGCLKKIENYIQILVIKEFSFMSKVLITEQREQAGSDSYNRFEYQVHWIVCYIIGKMQENAKCIVFVNFTTIWPNFPPTINNTNFFR